MREYNKRPDDELAVITKSKKLCLYVLSVTDKSPKKFRFTLISRLQGYSLDIVEYLYRANDIVIGKNNTQSEQNERLAYQKKAMSTIRLLEYISEIAMLSNCILPKQFIIILHPDKESIKKILVAMTEYVEGELKLEFNEKTQIHHIRQGVQYLGFRFYLTENGKVIRLLRAQNKRKLRKRITKFGKMISNDQIDYTNLHSSLVSTRGHLLHGNTYNLRTRYFTELDNIIYTHDMEKADMQIAYLIETNNKPIQGGRA